MTPFVELISQGAVAYIAPRRPEKLNALDRDMVEALDEAARAIEVSRETCAVILFGEGKAFCAGGDIAVWGALPALEMWRDWTHGGHRAFEAPARLRVPLIAALTGHAYGGGLELVAVADIRIAERGIELGLPETGLGMIPGWSPDPPFWCLRGAPYGAERTSVRGGGGLRLALVDEVIAANEALNRAKRLAADVAARGPLAVQMAKAMINAAEGKGMRRSKGLPGRSPR